MRTGTVIPDADRHSQSGRDLLSSHCIQTQQRGSKPGATLSREGFDVVLGDLFGPVYPVDVHANTDALRLVQRAVFATSSVVEILARMLT
jgi:hypothetical protein